MRTKTDILDRLIIMILEYQNKRRRPVNKIYLSEKSYDNLMTELQKEELDTIYGADIRITKQTNKKIILL